VLLAVLRLLICPSKRFQNNSYERFRNEPLGFVPFDSTRNMLDFAGNLAA
jgi:hypothetical protein